MDRNRLTYRKTTFDIPSNRNLWLTLGQYDALVEYQEVASRDIILILSMPRKSLSMPFLAALLLLQG